MTSPVFDVSVPATAIDGLDVRQHEAELARRFPGVGIWYGTHTRTWWAQVRDAHGVWRHVEAPGPFSLADQLDILLAPAWAAPATPVRPEAIWDSVRPVVDAPTMTGRAGVSVRPVGTHGSDQRRARPRWGDVTGRGRAPK